MFDHKSRDELREQKSLTDDDTHAAKIGPGVKQLQIGSRLLGLLFDCDIFLNFIVLELRGEIGVR